MVTSAHTLSDAPFDLHHSDNHILSLDQPERNRSRTEIPMYRLRPLNLLPLVELAHQVESKDGLTDRDDSEARSSDFISDHFHQPSLKGIWFNHDQRPFRGGCLHSR